MVFGMNELPTSPNKSSAFISKKTSHFEHKAYRDRRRHEMKRRFLTLQSKRTHLERELEIIKASLISLDKQMKHYDAFEQLTIN